ncbi:MAG: hypothetical protein AB7N65_29205 [Vicinamibacterales bacterium]
MSRLLRTTAALAAAVVVLVLLALPPAQLVPADPAPDGSVPGAFHVHTNRSDGLSSPDVVAQAAARAGLRFIVFTDHGDGTRKPDPPTYRAGVLCLDGVEISTQSGHLIALGIPQAPYPLAGEARDVLEDVHRLGGFGIAAHPDSPRADLRWTEWDAPIDGLEIVNLDSVWRAHIASGGWRMAARVARDLATYLVRPSETIAAMVHAGGEAATSWAALAGDRRLPLFAGADAHARLELRGGDPPRGSFALALPGYETVFRTLSMRVRTEGPLNGDASHDGDLLLRALRAGHSYAAFDAILSPPAFQLKLTSGSVEVVDGGDLVDQGPIMLSVTSNAPPSFTTTIWRNGTLLASHGATPVLSVSAPPGPGAYRVEIRATDRPAATPWLLSNAIVVRSAAEPATSRSSEEETAASANAPVRWLLSDRDEASWTTEASPASKVALEIGNQDGRRDLRVRFGLPGGDVYGQYAAVAAAIDTPIAAHRVLQFTARASQPMRISVQLRVPEGQEGHRWRRSIYVDETSRTYVLQLRDFRPAGETPSALAPLDAVRSVLFVIDQANTAPGTSGRVWLSEIGLR